MNLIGPERVQSLKCREESSSTLTISWEETNSEGIIDYVSYKVNVLKVQHMSFGTRDLESVPLIPAFSEEVNEKHVEVTRGIGMYSNALFFNSLGCFIVTCFKNIFSEAEVPYNITVKAVNLAGCSQERQVYCFTQEGSM